MNDLGKTEDSFVIYKFEPKSNQKNIFISFLGNSTNGSFDFYLYSKLSDISEDKLFTKYLEKFENYGETQLKNQSLDVYYILVKMNPNNEKYEEYKYLSFMMFNLEEYLDISKYNEYILAFEGCKNITFNYPAQNISQYFYIEVKTTYKDLFYELYENNSEPKLIKSENKTELPVKHYKGLFKENNTYYIKLSFKNYYKMIRIIIYFLDNDKKIIKVEDTEKDIKYGILPIKIEIFWG